MSSKSGWTYEQNKRFENGLAVYVDNNDVPSGDRWEKIAKAVGEGKSVEDVRKHYKALEQDIMLIESGAVPLPNYSKSGNKNGDKGKSIIREEERFSMNSLIRAFRYCHEKLQPEALQRRIQRFNNPMTGEAFSQHRYVISPPYLHQKGLENTTVNDILMNKGEEKVGSWLWCRTDHTADDAAKQMARYNIGSLVVLRPGEEQNIAGIITERDYLHKVIASDRSSFTRVGDIMTDQKKLITVTSETNILQAMQLMTENHIRHVPVIDGKIVGMISVTDVVRAVVGQQSGDMQRMNDFIKGEYY